MDFEKALNKITLTQKQEYVLRNVLDGINITEDESSTFNHIVEKMKKELN